jgi:hypothetical protein
MITRELHYGAWATERLAERLRLGGSRKLSLIAEGVAARTGRPVGEVMRLLVEARPEPEAPPGAKEPAGKDTESMANLRALAALIAQTTADARPSERSRGAQAGSPPEPRHGGPGTL